MRILKETEEAGLIHTSMNVQEGHSYICNCCTCCCGILRGLTEWEQPLAFVNSDYVISVNKEACISCGKCVKVCQMNALEVIDKKSVINDKCIGCGVCAINCPQSALELVLRDRKEIKKPPKNIIRWMIRRSISRRKNILKVM
ncbi:MAG: ATP-binding protein [Candidatus Heimdallarchaeaceae archaeon]